MGKDTRFPGRTRGSPDDRCTQLRTQTQNAGFCPGHKWRIKGEFLMLPQHGKVYNPAMGFISAPEVDAWLRGGGLVVAASERAARAIKAGFHRARRAEGLTAWPAPQVLDW